MPETLTITHETPVAQPLPQQTEVQSGRLAAERQALVGSMVQHGLISEDFSRSGAIEAFSMDESLGWDALPHILVGDKYGGAHHLPTIVGLGVEGTQVYSTFVKPESPKKDRNYYKRSQGVRDNGVFEAKNVRISDETDRVMEKAHGSTFFPNEWTTQQVLEAIIATSQQPGTHNPDRHSRTHVGNVEGVTVTVITDDFTGKIVAAKPGRG
jgi:hypothetical protein